MSGSIAHPHLPQRANPASRRLLFICILAFVIALGAALLAEVLVALIGLITNLAFYGRVSLAFTSPAENHLGLWVILIPVIGGLVVGFMARWGITRHPRSRHSRGDGARAAG